MSTTTDLPQQCVIGFATKGSGSNEEDRLRALLSRCNATILPFDKKNKRRSFLSLIRSLSRTRRRLIVMEGTGLAGGLACLIGRIFFGHRYVVSSGDAIGPFIGSHIRFLGWPYGIYERVLCRLSSGFIGWTPYLVGRAMTFGAPRGVTAAGWVIGQNIADRDSARAEVRREWGIPNETLVFGIAGALVWNRRREYCYGLELVKAIRNVGRDDVAVVIIGDGSGIDPLRDAAGDDLGKRVFLPGRVPLDRVMSCLCGFDVASLPQSTDAVGSFRYTTKISEYRGARLPIVTSRIPAAYDLDLGSGWRLPGANPWDPEYIDSLTDVMESVSRETLNEMQQTEAGFDVTFTKETQIERVTEFIRELIEDQKIGHGDIEHRDIEHSSDAESVGRWSIHAVTPLVKLDRS